MKLYRVLNDPTAERHTELFLSMAMAARLLHLKPDQAAKHGLDLVLPKYGRLIQKLMDESTPGIMNYMVMPAVIDAQHALVIDLYIDWNDEAEKLAGQKVRPTYKPYVLVSYYICAPNELKALHQLVQNELPKYTDLTQKETA